MKLDNYLDTKKLEEYIEKGFVSRQFHPEFPLAILNYTHEAMFENLWDEVTTRTRGLIYNKVTQEIVARPFEMFFNLNHTGVESTQEANLPKREPDEITDKMDGSLGIGYQYKGKWAVATRGSFTFDQALWATEFLNERKAFTWASGMTPLFEVIYPENRIVLDYGGKKSLVLLAYVGIPTGLECKYSLCEKLAKINNLDVVERFHKTLTECMAENIPNKEGYVLKWNNETGPPIRVKVKFADYVRLHKLLTGVNAKDVWDMLKAEQDFSPLYEGTPPEFISWIRTVKGNLEDSFKRRESLARGIMRALGDYVAVGGPALRTRKEIALFITNPRHQRELWPVCFTMLDGKPYADIIWKQLKPSGNYTFVKGEKKGVEC